MRVLYGGFILHSDYYHLTQQVGRCQLSYQSHLQTIFDSGIVAAMFFLCLPTLRGGGGEEELPISR